MLWVLLVEGVADEEECRVNTGIHNVLQIIYGKESCSLISSTRSHTSYTMEFSISAEEMPVGRELMRELRKVFDVKAVTVTRDCWYEHSKGALPIQWTNEGVTVYTDMSLSHCDVWRLHVNNTEVCKVYYIPTLTADWKKSDARSLFGNSQFACMMQDNFIALKSTDINPALREAEDEYEKYIRNRVAEAEAILSAIQNNLQNFLEWKEK